MVTFVSATLLVLTLTNSSNSVTMTTTEVVDLTSCQAIGKEWVENSPRKHPNPRTYECLQHKIYRGR